MSYQTDNAVIMAAGISSRFAPLSYEKPKALMEVKGEILIERQIRQLLEAGIQETSRRSLSGKDILCQVPSSFWVSSVPSTTQ